MTRTIFALGGNALVDDDVASHEEQLATVRRAVEGLDASVESDRDIVWIHGNGPQVGYRLLEQEAAETPTVPLSGLVAETQGQLGHLLARALDATWPGTTTTVVTRVVVDDDDPAFDTPSKPVGPRYSQAEAEEKPFETAAVAEGERPYRRVVASPRPRRVVEADAIETLLDRGVRVVCGGGGGVPVVETGDGFVGRAAVVDKDHTAALLGRRLDAAELVFLTDVPFAYLGYGTEEQRPITHVTPATLRTYIQQGEFGEGSMRPKAEACASFVEAGGKRAIITSPDEAHLALAGSAGTRVQATAFPE